MKLNIIHLKHRMDRLVSLQREMSEQGIDFELWDGIVDVQKPFTGISKAHKRIVMDAAMRNLPKVCIGEDDIRFCDKGAWQYFLDNEPEDYDIYLASVYTGHIDENNETKDFSGLTLYMVHQKFYTTFLATNELNHLDRALFKRGKYVVCNPFAAIQYNGLSDNKKKIMNYDSYMNGRKLFTNNFAALPNNDL